jgi:hypothetical protein
VVDVGRDEAEGIGQRLRSFGRGGGVIEGEEGVEGEVGGVAIVTEKKERDVSEPGWWGRKATDDGLTREGGAARLDRPEKRFR